MKKGGRKNSFISAKLNKQIGSNHKTEGVKYLCTYGARFWTGNRKVLRISHVKSENIKILREGNVYALIWIEPNRMTVKLCKKKKKCGC